MNYTTNLTKLYANGNNPDIMGRDKELEILFLTMLRFEKPNAVLLGEPGVGKTALAHQMAYLIANDLCPAPLKGFQVIEVNTNSLIAGPGYRGTTEQKFDDMIKTSLSSGKTILFIDEFHTVEHLGEMANGQTPGLGNTLKPYLTRPDFRLIGATTNREYDQIVDKALLRRFFKILVSEPNEEAVKKIITSCVSKYGKGITFKKGIVDKIYELSIAMDGFNPDKAKDITDFTCSYCKMKSINTVTVSTVSDIFDSYFLFKQKETEQDKVAIIE